MRISRAIVVACLVLASYITGAARAAESIRIVGSSRMEPLVRAFAEQYNKARPDAIFDIRGGGSDVGVRALVNGHAAIAMLARPATELERNYVRTAKKTDLVGIPVAMDAVVFVVAPENPIDVLSLAQIQAIFSYQLTQWKELGVSPDAFPAAAHLPQSGHGRTDELLINRYLPSQNNGSVEVLQIAALHGKRLAVSAGEYESMVELTKAVAADPFGIGFGGRSQVEGLKVLAVQVDADSPAMSPTPAALRDRSYPLSHYLYFYFVGQPAGEVKEFLRFVVSPEGQRVVADAGTGLVTLPLIGGPPDG